MLSFLKLPNEEEKRLFDPVEGIFSLSINGELGRIFKDFGVDNEFVGVKDPTESFEEIVVDPDNFDLILAIGWKKLK